MRGDMVVRERLKGKKEEEPDLSRGWFLLAGHMMVQTNGMQVSRAPRG